MTTISIKRFRAGSAVAALTAAALVLSSCSSDDSDDSAADSVTVANPVAITYDGGIALLDGQSLKLASKIELAGFNRVNPVGDDDHVMVSTESGFTVLDAAHATLTDIVFPGAKPGHVVVHDGRTVLFTDSTGGIVSFDPHDLAEGKPEVRTATSAAAHHGVAVELTDGTIVASVGTEEGRTGAHAIDASGKEIASSADCPGLHGEAAASGDVIGFGCHDGVLLFKNGTFVKVKAGDAYGATSTQSGSDASPVLLGNYKTDEDAEFEAPKQFVLIDTVNQRHRVVPMPGGASYSSRSLGRGPSGEALILGTDGKLHVIDPASGAVTKSISVVGAWQEPEDWQDPRPSLFVRGSDAYVTDPATKSIKRIDLSSGEIASEQSLDITPNEISGAVHKH